MSTEDDEWKPGIRQRFARWCAIWSAGSEQAAIELSDGSWGLRYLIRVGWPDRLEKRAAAAFASKRGPRPPMPSDRLLK